MSFSVCKLKDCHIFKECYTLNFAKSIGGNACSSSGQLHFYKPHHLHDNQKNVFGVDIYTMHSHVAFQVCCIPTYFVTELQRITNSLLWKDMNRICIRLQAVMRSHMRSKSCIGQKKKKKTTANVRNMSWLKSMNYRVQVKIVFNMYLSHTLPYYMHTQTCKYMWEGLT